MASFPLPPPSLQAPAPKAHVSMPAPNPESTVIAIGCKQVPGAQGTRVRIEAMDLGKSSGGDLFLLSGQELWMWKQTDRGHKFLEKKLVPTPPRGSDQFFDAPIWRNGSFWFSKGRKTAVRHDRGSGQWIPVHDFKDDAAALEIASTGQIIRIGAPSHFIEVWEAGAERPLKVIDYPDLDMSAPDRRVLQKSLWGKFRTAICDEYVVIYAPVLGRMYAFDTSRSQLRELTVPWPTLETRGLGKKVAKDGGILCLGFPAPGCIQLIPDHGLQVKAVFQIPEVEIVGTQKIGPMMSAPMLKRKAGTEERVQTVSWSLFDGSKDEVQRDSGLQLPVWLDGRGDLLPLDRVLAKAEQSQPVTVPEVGRKK